MVVATSKPDNWAFLAKDTKAAEEPSLPEYEGKQTGWLGKMKNDSAKGKWLSDTNWRFFTADFDDQIIFYSAYSGLQKQVSSLIAFSDIVDVKLMENAGHLKRGLKERMLGNSYGDGNIGLCLITTEREIRLLSKTKKDAEAWVSIFNAAKRVAKSEAAPKMMKSPSTGSSGLSTILNSSDGTGSSAPQMSDTDSDGSAGKMRPWEKNQHPTTSTNSWFAETNTTASTTTSTTTGYGGSWLYGEAPASTPLPWEQRPQPTPAPGGAPPLWVQPTPEPGSKQDPIFEPDAEDAFAALDALVDQTYLPEDDAPKVDFATAIKAAKAKRAEKAIGDATAPEENGYASTQQPVAPKNMTPEDRSANDIALLKRQQMFPKSRQPKPKTENAPPLTTTRPCKRSNGLEVQEREVAPTFTITKFTDQGWVSESVTVETAQQASGPSKEAKKLAFEDVADDDDDDSKSQNKKERPCTKGTSAAPAVADKALAWDDWDDETPAAQSSKAATTSSQEKTFIPEPAANDDDPWDSDGDNKKTLQAKAKSSKEKVFMPEPAAHDDDPWDSEDDNKKPKAPKSVKFAGVQGPSEGTTVDKESWDDDEPLRTSLKKKKSKGNRKPSKDASLEEDDPTAGLEDLVDSVATGKPVALKVHEYVDGFQCMQCDFKVIRFTDFEWAPQADYLFFRNYYGKPKKLPRMLKDSHGSSAYCCQCAFKSVSSRMALKDVAEETRWKCVSA